MAACWVLASDKFWFSSVFKKKKSHSKIRTLPSSPDSWLLWPHGAAFPYGVTARSQAASFRGSKRSLGSRPLWPSLTWHRHKHLNPVFFTHLPYLPGPCTHLRFYSMKLKDHFGPEEDTGIIMQRPKLLYFRYIFDTWERIFIISLITYLLHVILSSVLYFQEFS